MYASKRGPVSPPYCRKRSELPAGCPALSGPCYGLRGSSCNRRGPALYRRGRPRTSLVQAFGPGLPLRVKPEMLHPLFQIELKVYGVAADVFHAFAGQLRVFFAHHDHWFANLELGMHHPFAVGPRHGEALLSAEGPLVEFYGLAAIFSTRYGVTP